MAQILEALMVLCFGLSWPTAIVKSYKSKTAEGKSIIFIIFILLGYIFGVGAKLILGDINYVFVIYVLNLLMVLIDLGLFFRNKKLDKERELKNYCNSKEAA